MRHWPKIALGDVLCRSSEPAVCMPDAEYDEVTIRLWGKGVISRGKVLGADVTTPRRVVRANQLILSKIDARNGAIGLVPQELDGAIVSNDFPSFEFADSRQLDPAFMGWMVRSRHFVDLCKAASEGTTNRVRIKEDRFLAQQIVLPPLSEQQAIVSRLDTLADKVRQVNDHLDAIERDAEWLLAVQYNDLCRDSDPRELGALLMPSTEYVALELDEEYEEITIRLWGKGIVSRGRLLGSQIRSTRRLLSDNQLVFSKIDVRHGAIGIVPKVLAGAVVSNDFPSFDIDNNKITTEFLSYIVSSEGFINRCKEASSGTTNRVRLSEGTFLRLTVPVPSLKRQRTFDALQAKVTELKARHAPIRQANDALIPATLERVFSGGD